MSLWIIASLLLAYSGLLGLCLGLERHYKQLYQRLPGAGLQRLLRTVGWALLGASLACCAQAWGWAMAGVGWLGLVSLAGVTLVMLLPYAPRLSVWLAGAGWPVLGVMALV